MTLGVHGERTGCEQRCPSQRYYRGISCRRWLVQLLIHTCVDVLALMLLWHDHKQHIGLQVTAVGLFLTPLCLTRQIQASQELPARSKKSTRIALHSAKNKSTTARIQLATKPTSQRFPSTCFILRVRSRWQGKDRTKAGVNCSLDLLNIFVCCIYLARLRCRPRPKASLSLRIT